MNGILFSGVTGILTYPTAGFSDRHIGLLYSPGSCVNGSSFFCEALDFDSLLE